MQNNDIIMGTFHAALSFLKDYVMKFCRCDFELAHLYGTEDFVAKITFILPEAELLEDGPIDDPVLGIFYTARNTNKDFSVSLTNT